MATSFFNPRTIPFFHAEDASGYRVLNIHLPWSDSRVYWDAGNSGGPTYDRIDRAAAPAEFEGQWNHWVFTKDAVSGVMNIYLNGALWHSGGGRTRAMNGIVSASLGSLDGTQFFYDGSIDDVRIYDEALNAAAIGALYGVYSNAPPSFTINPVVTANASEDVPYTGETLASFATDPDAHNTLTYTKQFGPAWLSVAANGALSGTPSQNDMGGNVFTVQVSDGNGGTDQATLAITVLGVNDAPVFTSTSFSAFNTLTNVPYYDTIAGRATDEEGDPLTYSKVSGPAWLMVAANGVLSGTPGVGDLGTNIFTVEVSAGGTDQATLSIIVLGGPRAHWALDDGSGTTATDHSGNGHTGTVSGATWTNGVIGGALDFASANNASVDIPVAAFSNISAGITISMWVHGDAAMQPQNDSIFYANDAGGNRVLNIHLPWGNSRVYWDAGNSGGATYDRIDKAAVPAEFEGQWNHWVFTKDAVANALNIYLNGALWHSGPGTRTMNGITSASFGSQLGVASFYDGWIDDVRLYDVALSPSAIGAIYDAGTTNPAPIPNPAMFAAPPTADSDTAISMTAITGTSSNNPVEYLFSETSGNPGGTSSGWQLSPTYTDTGLASSTPYTYTVTMRDSLSNTGMASAPTGATTDSTPTGNTPPVFLSNPVVGINATEGVGYNGTLTNDVIDLNPGDTLTFEKLSGPAWLTVAGDGSLSGTPGAGTPGLNTWIVEVTDCQNPAVLGLLVIDVQYNVTPPIVINDPAGATDIVWPGRATLRGSLTSGVAAEVTIYYGTNDGGMVQAAWSNSVQLGQELEAIPFASIVSGLASDTTYFYRSYATNAAGEDWADTASSFQSAMVSSSLVYWDNGGVDALWTTPENWDDDLAPSAGKEYCVDSFTIQSPDSGVMNFGGDRLGITGGDLFLRRTWNFTIGTVNVNIPNLSMHDSEISPSSSNGSLRYNMNNSVHFTGDNTIALDSGGGYEIFLRLAGGMTGSGSMVVRRTSQGLTRAMELTGDNSGYSGDWLIENPANAETLTLNVTHPSGWGTGNLDLGTYGRLHMSGANVNAGNSDVAMLSSTATIDVGGGNHTVRTLTLGNSPVPMGTFTAAQLAAFGLGGNFAGSGTLTILQGPVAVSLDTVSVYGNPTPSAGTTFWFPGANIMAMAPTPATNAGMSVATNTGWFGSGSVPASGSSNQVSFTINSNSTISWQWILTDYFLEFLHLHGVASDVVTGYYPVGSNITVTASPTNILWRGDTTGCTIGPDHVITCPMDQSRRLVSGIPGMFIPWDDGGPNDLWTTPENWIDDLPVHPAFPYLVEGSRVQSPDAGGYTFGGAGLTVANGGDLFLRRTWNFTLGNVNVNIPNLSIESGKISPSSSNGSIRYILANPVNFSGVNTIDMNAGGGYEIFLRLNGGMTGSGLIHAWRTAQGSTRSVELLGDNSGYSGDWLLENLSNGEIMTLYVSHPSGWGTGHVTLGRYGQLQIRNNIMAHGSYIVMDSTARLDLGAFDSCVGGLTFNGFSVPPGQYTAAELNTLTGSAQFFGTGTLCILDVGIWNEPATGITTNSAVLNATVISRTTGVCLTVYWGPVDAGTNSAGWSNSAPAGCISNNFDPLVDIGGLGLWLHAGAGVQTNAGGAVTNWLDQSGAGHQAAPPAAGAEPLLVAGALNGEPAIRFDGIDDGFLLGDLSASFPTGATLFVVCTLNADDAYNLFSTRNNDEWWRFNGNGYEYPGVFRTTRIEAYRPSMPTTGSHIFTIESTGGAWEQWIDGLSGGAAAGDYNPGDDYRIGLADNVQPLKNLQGDIAEILIYNRALSTNERNQVGRYLTEKYDMSASYNHPFPVSVPVTGLAPATDYYYAFRATGPATDIWAQPSEPFRTHFLSFNTNSFAFNVKIQFCGYNRNQTLQHFPALVQLDTNITGFSYSQFASASGGDLRFLDESKSFELHYEVESWDTNGTSYVWVQIPQLVDNTTCMYAYWGDSGSVTPPAYTTNGATWSDHYGGVWHLHSTNAAGQLPDSGPGGFHGPDEGNTVNIAGQIGDAQDWEGADSVTLPVGAFADITDEVTIELWQFGDAATQPQSDFIFLGQAGASRELGSHAPWNNSQVYWDAFGNYDRINRGAGASEFEGQWNNWVFTKNRITGTMTIYLNGVPWHSGSGLTRVYNPVDAFRLGSDIGGGLNYDGVIDEFRVSTVERSPDWLWAAWYNTASNDQFNCAGIVSGSSVDLDLTKTATPFTLLTGSSVVYNITVSNLSSMTAGGIIVTDSLPIGVHYEFSVPIASETNGNNYTFNLGSLTSGGSTTITINIGVTSSVPGTMTNWASVVTTNAEFILGNNRAFAETIIPDSDGDGISNPVDPDDDNDNFPDEAERIANTDPFDPSSFFWARISRTGAQPVQDLTFLTSTGRTYRIEGTTNLFTGPWINLRSNIPGTGLNIVIPDTNVVERMYYRIGVESP